MDTHFKELPIIGVHVPSRAIESNFLGMMVDYHNLPVFSPDVLDHFMKSASISCPGVVFITDQAALLSIVPIKRVVAAFHIANVTDDTVFAEYFSFHFGPNGSRDHIHSGHVCYSKMFENRTIYTIADWKESLNVVLCTSLPVSVNRRSIIPTAVESFMALDKQPFFAPHQLFHRNLEVKFVGEEGLDQGGLRNEFFSLFFQEIIENSGLFTLNSQGYVVISSNRTSLEDLDTYEAFGFYLAKAFQNNIPIGCQFSELLVDMIRSGKLDFSNLNRLETWDHQLAHSLKSLTNMSDSALKDFNFNDINPKYASIAVDKLNLKIFIFEKVRRSINSQYRAQFLMIALGFARGCPVYLLPRSQIDLKADFLGSKSLTAAKLFSSMSASFENGSIAPINHFCKWLETLTSEQLMLFFRFLTGMKVLPPGDLSSLRITLIVSAQGTEHKLPQANTCQKKLTLPPYPTEEIAFEKLNSLMRLIESGEAFEFGNF